MRRADGVHLRGVAATAPDPRAVPTLASLEEAYLRHLAAGREAA